MKRGLSILFLLVVLSSFLVLAANQTETTQTTTLKERTNTALEKDVEMPENLQNLARIFLGVKEDKPIDVQTFTVLIVTFIIFFFIMKEIMPVIPFFEEGWKTWLGALIITSLTGLSGGLLIFTMFLTDLGHLFGFISNHLISMIISIFFIILIFKILQIFRKNMERKLRPQIAAQKGYEEGMWDKMSSKIMRLFGKIPK